MTELELERGGLGTLPAGARAAARARTRRVKARAWVWLPIAIGGVQLIVLVARLKAILAALYLNGDTASASVIGSWLGTGHGTQFVTLGHYPWYEAIWFMELTRSLPAHREIWELAPVGFVVLGYALTVWSTWRLFGRWSAALTAVILASTTPALRSSLFALNAHGASVVHGCVLGASLALVTLKAERCSARALVGLAVLLGLFTAMGEGSDRLLLVCGIAPFLVTGGLLWWHGRGLAQRKIAAFALVTSVVAVAGGETAAAAMRAAHVTPAPHFSLQILPLSQLIPSLKIFLHAFTYLGGGDLLGSGVTRPDALAAAGGALALLGAVVVLVRLSRPALRVVRTAAEPPEPMEAARTAYVLFWGLTLVGVVVAFLFSSASVDAYSARYLLSTFVAAAALLPVLAARTRLARGALIAGVSAFALIGIHGLFGNQATSSSYPSGSTAVALERYLVADHLRYGYGPYWDAADLTWNSNLKVEVFPAVGCEPFGRPTACPYFLHTVSDWYEPRPGARTFLLVDPLAAGPQPVPAFGRPASVAHVGRFTIYVYDHDLARDMPPMPGWPSRPTLIGAASGNAA